MFHSDANQDSVIKFFKKVAENIMLWTGYICPQESS